MSKSLLSAQEQEIHIFVCGKTRSGVADVGWRYRQLSDVMEIFKEIKNQPWPHVIVRDCLPADDIVFCNQLVKNINIENLPEDDKQGDIITKTLTKKDLEGTSLKQIFNNGFHKKVLKHWSVQHQQGFSYNVVLDYCGPDGSNGWHTDIGNSHDACDIITLQWYIDQPHKNRTLMLKSPQGGTDSKCMTNDFIMFKSAPNTQHMFMHGVGHRLSIRLRIKTKLIGPDILHCPDQSDPIGVIIDCKDMESKSSVESLEHNLGNFTKINLEHYDWHNICLIDSHIQFQEAVDNLRSNGCKKIVVLFAGAIVSSQTKELISALDGWHAHKHDYRVFRKYIVFPADTDLKIQQQSLYGGNIIDMVENKHNHELGIFYVHPENDTNIFLKNVQRFLMPQITNDQQDFLEIGNFIQKFW